MIELTQEYKDIIIAFARFYTGAEHIYFHKFANKKGYMLVIETNNLEGFLKFLNWFHSETEIKEIDIIHTLPEEEV